MAQDTQKLSQLQGKIWFNGGLVDWADATVHVLTHSLHYGTGVFEGVRAYETPSGPAVFRLAEHTRRLGESARTIGMQLPYGYQELFDAQLEVVAANGLSNAYIRPLAFYDDTGLGISVSGHGVNVVIATLNWGAYLGKEALENGIHIGVSSYRRHSPSISMCHAKVTGNYINSVLAKQEALQAGFAEALLLDTEGYVSEGSGENIFLVAGGRIVTPSVESNLDGITRQTVIELAVERGYEVVGKRLARDEVYAADEVFFTGTAAEVTPVSKVDHRAIGSGTRGPVTRELQEAYFDCVHGRDASREGWLTYVAKGERKAA